MSLVGGGKRTGSSEKRRHEAARTETLGSAEDGRFASGRGSVAAATDLEEGQRDHGAVRDVPAEQREVRRDVVLHKVEVEPAKVDGVAHLRTTAEGS